MGRKVGWGRLDKTDEKRAQTASGQTEQRDEPASIQNFHQETDTPASWKSEAKSGQSHVALPAPAGSGYLGTTAAKIAANCPLAWATRQTSRACSRRERRRNAWPIRFHQASNAFRSAAFNRFDTKLSWRHGVGLGMLRLFAGAVLRLGIDCAFLPVSRAMMKVQPKRETLSTPGIIRVAYRLHLQGSLLRPSRQAGHARAIERGVGRQALMRSLTNGVRCLAATPLLDHRTAPLSTANRNQPWPTVARLLPFVNQCVQLLHKLQRFNAFNASRFNGSTLPASAFP